MPRSKQERLLSTLKEWTEIDHDSHVVAIKARDIFAQFLIEETKGKAGTEFYAALHTAFDSMAGAMQSFDTEWRQIDVAHANGKD